MAKAGYMCRTEAAVGLTGGAAKTILAVVGPSTFGVDLKKIRIGFDGTTSSAAPVLVDLCLNDQSSNSTPGTNNTAGTVQQIYGRSITAGFTTFYNSTSEPTTLTVIESFLLTPISGLLFYDWPLGDTPDCNVSDGFVLRCNSPTNVNVRGSMMFERC